MPGTMPLRGTAAVKSWSASVLNSVSSGVMQQGTHTNPVLVAESVRTNTVALVGVTLPTRGSWVRMAPQAVDAVHRRTPMERRRSSLSDFMRGLRAFLLEPGG